MTTATNLMLPTAVADAKAAKAPEFQWLQVMELGYAEDATRGNVAALENQAPVCFHCGKEAAADAKLSKCARCQVASYCSRKCQVTHWKGGNDKVGHKYSCPGKVHGPPFIAVVPLRVIRLPLSFNFHVSV